MLAVGAKHSYGITPLNSGHRLIDMTGLDRFIAFDAQNGLISAEAGLTIGDLLRIIVPKGWFIPTTPGTRFVTLGGAVAHDVHGKNHHQAGSFGCSLARLGLLRSDGSKLDLVAEQGADLYRATVSGMGLTGVISFVELMLAPIRSAFLDVEYVAFASIRELLQLASESAREFEHTVAWLDCMTNSPRLGRGIFERANWRDDGDLTPHRPRGGWTIPTDMPSFTLNQPMIRLFNTFYYRLQASKRARRRLHYATFFYPLDAVRHWNRLYGPRGFYEYQCVIPLRGAELVINELFRQMERSGERPYFAVLKTLGAKPSPGLIAFSREGATLALDFPNKGAKTLSLLAQFDSIIRDAGGRLYPAKDGRMSAEMFRSGYPGWSSFAQHVDPRFMSDFWAEVSAG